MSIESTKFYLFHLWMICVYRAMFKFGILFNFDSNIPKLTRSLGFLPAKNTKVLRFFLRLLWPILKAINKKGYFKEYLEIADIFVSKDFTDKSLVVQANRCAIALGCKFDREKKYYEIFEIDTACYWREKFLFEFENRIFVEAIVSLDRLESFNDQHSNIEVENFLVSYKFWYMSSIGHNFSDNRLKDLVGVRAKLIFGYFVNDFDILNFLNLGSHGQLSREFRGKLALETIKKIQNFNRSKSKLPLLDGDNFQQFCDRIHEIHAFIKGCSWFGKSSSVGRLKIKSKNILAISDNWHFTKYLFKTMDDAGLSVDKYTFSDIVDDSSDFSKFYAPLQNNEERLNSLKKVFDENIQLKALFEKADTLFIEWGTLPAVWCSRYLIGEKKVVLRIHSFEVFSPYLYFINWTNVDHLIFVGVHVREIAILQIPFVASIPYTILPNLNDFAKFRKKKIESAEYTLGMAVYNTSNKDPLFAAQILEKLVKINPKWSLRFAGHGFEAKGSQSEKEYENRFLGYIDRMGLGNHVQFDGYQENIENWYQNIGYILSCSHRESAQETVLQGIASGSVPVIRDWPLMKAFDGAKSCYSDFSENIFESVEQAVEIILNNNVASDCFKMSDSISSESGNDLIRIFG